MMICPVNGDWVCMAQDTVVIEGQRASTGYQVTCAVHQQFVLFLQVHFGDEFQCQTVFLGKLFDELVVKALHVSFVIDMK